MSDLNQYVSKRFKTKPKVKNSFWHGYDDFKIGVILKEARKEAGLTQEQIANKIHTTKSVISRIENHAEDIRLSTIEKFADALGKKVKITIL